MSSLDFLNNFINPERVRNGEGQHENGKFILKVEDELDDLPAPTFIRRFGNNVKIYTLTVEQMTLVGMRESKSVRRAVLQKLKELSDPQTPALPTTFAEALQLAADQAKQLELAAPKVEFVDRYVDSKGSFTFRQVAKQLKVKEPDLKAFLIKHKIMYVLGGNLTAYQPHIEAGRFIVKTGTSTTTNHAFTQARFTPKGFEWLSDIWRKEKNEGSI